jgi:hypothetical protein
VFLTDPSRPNSTAHQNHYKTQTNLPGNWNDTYSHTLVDMWKAKQVAVAVAEVWHKRADTTVRIVVYSQLQCHDAEVSKIGLLATGKC